MGRLARWLFTLCSAASLVLCVAVCVLWVRTYKTAESLDWYPSFEEPREGTQDSTRQVKWGASVARGSISVSRVEYGPWGNPGWGRRSTRRPSFVPDPSRPISFGTDLVFPRSRIEGTPRHYTPSACQCGALCS